MDNLIVSSGSDKPPNSGETAEIINTIKYGDERTAVVINSGNMDSSITLKDISSTIQANLPDNESTAPLNDDDSTRKMTGFRL
jgi:D-arabinose 5-phosphate isomerase GutQ